MLVVALTSVQREMRELLIEALQLVSPGIILGSLLRIINLSSRSLLYSHQDRFYRSSLLSCW